MREYKIFKTDLWWAIYRKKQVGSIVMMQYLNGNDLRTSKKILARTFYHREDAVSALVIQKRKDEWEKSD